MILPPHVVVIQQGQISTVRCTGCGASIRHGEPLGGPWIWAGEAFVNEHRACVTATQPHPANPQPSDDAQDGQQPIART